MQGILEFPDPAGSPISGEMVQLRPLCTADVKDLESAAGDCGIFQWFIDGWIIQKFGVGTYVYKLLEEQRAHTSVPFTVWHLEERRAIGVTRLYNIEKRSRTVEVATWYANDFHRTRVNTESKFLLLRHTFETLGFQRAGFEIDKRKRALKSKAHEKLAPSKKVSAATTWCWPMVTCAPPSCSASFAKSGHQGSNVT